MKFLYTGALILSISVLIPKLSSAQTDPLPRIGNTAIPFVNLTPDSRSGAMGEAGVALSPDVNANFWNPSKLAFLDNNDNVSIAYSPWLRQLVPDISLSYLSYAHKLDERSALGASIRYFNYGSIQYRDPSGTDQGLYNANEFSLNLAYSRKFGDDFSLGLTMGYIRSNFSTGTALSGTDQTSKPGNSIAAGVSMYYTKPTQEFGNDAIFSIGANISNIGSKISYSDNGQKFFIPANLKIGAANTWILDDYNQVTLALDFNKLLVPTPPQRDADGNVIAGKDDNVSVPAGIFGSFGGAPGGFSEVIKEFTVSPGLEYWYNQQFALRAGYLYKNASENVNPNTVGSSYVTLGVGFKYQSYAFDFSYIAGKQQTSGLANTLRFTLSAGFGGDTNAKKR